MLFISYQSRAKEIVYTLMKILSLVIYQKPSSSSPWNLFWRWSAIPRIQANILFSLKISIKTCWLQSYSAVCVCVMARGSDDQFKKFVISQALMKHLLCDIAHSKAWIKVHLLVLELHYMCCTRRGKTIYTRWRHSLVVKYATRWHIHSCEPTRLINRKCSAEFKIF